jgi:hypothetical protein
MAYIFLPNYAYLSPSGWCYQLGDRYTRISGNYFTRKCALRYLNCPRPEAEGNSSTVEHTFVCNNELVLCFIIANSCVLVFPTVWWPWSDHAPDRAISFFCVFDGRVSVLVQALCSSLCSSTVVSMSWKLTEELQPMSYVFRKYLFFTSECIPIDYYNDKNLSIDAYVLEIYYFD